MLRSLISLVRRNYAIEQKEERINDSDPSAYAAEENRILLCWIRSQAKLGPHTPFAYVTPRLAVQTERQ